MEQQCLSIGMKAPDFSAVTTFGNIKLSDYRGKWVIFFSHPGDFTPAAMGARLLHSEPARDGGPRQRTRLKSGKRFSGISRIKKHRISNEIRCFWYARADSNRWPVA